MDTDAERKCVFTKEGKHEREMWGARWEGREGEKVEKEKHSQEHNYNLFHQKKLL